MKILNSLKVNLQFRPNLTLTIEDINQINTHLIACMESLSKKTLQDRLEMVTVDEIESIDGLNRAIETLNESGIVVVPRFLKPGEADKVYKSIMSAYQEQTAVLEGDYFESRQSLVQVGTSILSGYAKLADYSKPVIQIRQGQDSGMVDIFNVDKLMGTKGNEMKALLDTAGLNNLINKNDINLKPSNLNCYINQGVTRTRGFHVDSYSSRMKAFVYLTDVTELTDGPYTYVKGSHRDTPYRKINKLLAANLPNKTEAPVVSLDDIMPVLAPKGALVISDQSGIHRGWPQNEDALRAIAVMNYRA